MAETEMITIPLEEYQILMDIKSEKDYEEDVSYREQQEKEEESARNRLLKKMYDLCIEFDDATDVVNTIIEEDSALVAEVFYNYSPLEIPGALMDFMEGTDYEEPIIGETKTLKDWIDLLHDPEDLKNVLLERCEELYKEKQDLIQSIQAFAKNL